MTSKSKRVLYTLFAFILGIGIVLALTMAGEKTKGPIEQILTTASNVVAKVEDKIILEEKTDKRIDKMKWLKTMTSNDKHWYKHSKAIFLGAYDNNTEQSFQPIIDLEDTLHTIFPLIHIYIGWGSKPEHQFPKSKIESIVELGSIPVVTWEPWLASFDNEAHPELKPLDKRDKDGMADVANGVYDFYIRKWALQAKKVGPMFIRLGHEMNDPYRYPWGPQNNTAAEYIAAWKHVYNVFKQEGATNVIWTWSPHPAYGYFKDYYPGDEYVDYVAIGTLNYGPVASWAKWWSFDEIFGKYYAELSSFHKPIMLSEFGSLSVGGSRSKWFGEALKDMPKKYPAVKSILFFHFDADKTTTQQVLDWYIIDDKSVVKSITNQMNNWNDSLKAGKK